MIGKLIKKARRNLEMTQEELAKKIGCHQETISSWENGQSNPTLIIGLKAMKILNLSLNELGETNDNNPTPEN